MSCPDQNKLLKRAGIDPTLDAVTKKKLVENHIEDLNEDMVRSIKQSLAIERIEAEINSIKPMKLSMFEKFKHRKKSKEELDEIALDKAFVEKANVMVASNYRSISGMASVEAMRHGILNQSFKRIHKFMEAAKPGMAGFYDRKGLHADVVRAKHGTYKGKDTEIPQYAKSLNDEVEYLRKRLSEASGIQFKKRKGVDEPTGHNREEIRKYSFDEWSDHMIARLDLDEMEINHSDIKRILAEGTEGKDGSPDRVSLYRQINRGFENVFTVGNRPIGTNVAGKHLKERFLIFKDVEGWIEYQTKFGLGDMYGAMIEEISSLARDIAIVERFGPNPKQGFVHAMNLIGNKIDNQSFAKRADIDFQNYLRMTESSDKQFAGKWATARNLALFVHLGGATQSALTDVKFANITHAFNGMPVMKFYKHFFSNLASTKRASENAGIYLAGMEHAQGVVSSSIRTAEVTGSNLSAKLAFATNYASFLNHWTVSGKAASSLIHHAGLAKNAHSKKGLNKDNLAMLRRYGITDEDIKVFKEAGTIKENGVIMPNYEKMPYQVSDKFVGAISTEVIAGVPQQTVRGKTRLHLGTKEGTGVGEIVRTSTQFAAFPVQVMVTHLNRALSLRGTSRIRYMGNLIVGLTMMGVMVTQLKQMTQGKEAYDWDSPELYKRGLLQGGGLGLIMDLVMVDIGFSTSAFDMLPAPVVRDLWKYGIAGVLGPSRLFASGEFEKGYKLALKNAGVVTTELNPLRQLWYTRGVVNKFFTEPVQDMTDEKAPLKRAKKERAEQKRKQGR